MGWIKVEGFLVAVGALLFFSPFTFATPILLEHEHFKVFDAYELDDLRYKVTDMGFDVDELAEEEPQNNESDPFTDWEVTWEFDSVQQNGICRPTNVHVYLKFNYQFPFWRNESVASAELRTRWQAFRRSLQSHERSHRKFAFKGAQQIERYLKLMSASSCDDFGIRAQQIADRVMEKVKRAEIAFDLKTKQGRARGATLQIPKQSRTQVSFR